MTTTERDAMVERCLERLHRLKLKEDEQAQRAVPMPSPPSIVRRGP